VFRWVSEGISAQWGLLAVWCQFAMTLFYYPTLRRKQPNASCGARGRGAGAGAARRA
jgi:hypothetical protein